MKPALARSVREMTPRASPSVFTTTSAPICWGFMLCAPSGSVVAGAQTITPSCIHSRTSGSPMGCHLVSPRRHRDLEDLAEAPPGRAKVFLDHRLPTLAEELPHRALHRPVDLVVRV